MRKQQIKLKQKNVTGLNDDVSKLASVNRQQIAIQIAIGKLEKQREQNEHYIKSLMEANQDPNELLANAYAKINKNVIYADIYHDNLKLTRNRI